MSKVMLFNPYSGKPRDPRDIASDPAGILMLDPDEPLRAARVPSGSGAPDQSQDWAGMDGATAFQLIERHGDGWADVGAKMEAWRDAAVEAAVLRDHQDAERYRWLRQANVIHQVAAEQTRLGRLTTLDNAVDSAIAAGQVPQGDA